MSGSRQHQTAPIPSRDPETSSAATTGLSDLLAGGGEMGALVRATDWAATPLGPVESWPQSLRTTAGVVLNNRFPMLLWWSPELYQIYNDAYRPILGAKHPRSLGQPGAEVWAEIWDILGPRVDRVRAGGGATWDEDLLLPMDRFGFVEETYFTFSYSPVPDEDVPGGIGGVLVTCTENTARVLGERRVRMLRDLGARSADATSAKEACDIAADALLRNSRDVPFALIYLIDDSGNRANLACATGIAPGTAAAPETVALDAVTADEDTGWPIVAVAHSRRQRVVSDVGTRFGSISAGEWPEPLRTAVVLPVSSTAADQIAGVLVVGVSPRLALDDSYRDFLDVAAGQVGAAIANARAYEAERRRAEALAELDRAKTEFFSNVSHEFRTPLTLILAPIEDALAEPRTLPENRERLAIMQRNALRLLKLVNTLLDFSRIEAGRTAAAFEATDLSSYTAELASTFRSAVERAGLRLVVDAPPLSERVFVDRDMWEKIILNLVSNAFKHTFDGEIAVRVRERDVHAEVVVSDTGVGIGASEIPRLFERFHRVPQARSRTHEGTGIGLALVQELVRLHGGRIDVASQEGAGSTFTVTIPFGTAHLPSEQLRTATRREPTATGLGAAPYVEEALRWLPESETEAPPSTPVQAPRPGEREASGAAEPESTRGAATACILLADDNADMRAYVARLLRDQGWAVEAVGDGRAALAAARARHPDLVLSDVMMPGLDGFELLRALRADRDTHTIPIILLSARAGEEARIEGAAAGADDYVVKPFAAHELVARVGAHLTLSRERARASAAVEAARAQLQQIFEKAPSFLAVLRGPDLVFELANDAYYQLIGHREVIGKSLWDALPEVRGQGFEALLEEVMATGVPYVGRERPIRIQRAPGVPPEERFLDFVYFRFDAGDGSGHGVIVHGTDVTDHVLARREVERSSREVAAANRAKSEFLAAMSHELRTPLNAIAGHAQLLEMEIHGPVTEQQHQALDRIRRSQQHLLSLINDVLNFAKLEAGRVEYDIVDLSVAAVVGEVLAMMELQVANRGLSVVVDIDPDLRVRADAEKLRQILLNLLSNAVKFTDRGGRIAIDTPARAEDDAREVDASVAFLRVSDTGIGISRERQDSVFDPFVQVNRDLTRNTEGTGLGLAISRDLARGMGGELRVRSVEGKGSTFTLTLHRAG